MNEGLLGALNASVVVLLALAGTLIVIVILVAIRAKEQIRMKASKRSGYELKMLVDQSTRKPEKYREE